MSLSRDGRCLCGAPECPSRFPDAEKPPGPGRSAWLEARAAFHPEAPPTLPMRLVEVPGDVDLSAAAAVPPARGSEEHPASGDGPAVGLLSPAEQNRRLELLQERALERARRERRGR